MRVTMKVDLSGTRNGEPWPRRGETVDLPDEEAAQLCASGMAETAKGKVEKAVPSKAEVAEPEPAEATEAPKAEKRGPGRPRRDASK
ncbi:hypothetical protein ADL26_13375 [Thermoactinomyces vulgaris]|nr:hypothetical protein ADL26_13375 [Thermoactinomyces vulgaris]